MHFLERQIYSHLYSPVRLWLTHWNMYYRNSLFFRRKNIFVCGKGTKIIYTNIIIQLIFSNEYTDGGRSGWNIILHKIFLHENFLDEIKSNYGTINTCTNITWKRNLWNTNCRIHEHCSCCWPVTLFLKFCTKIRKC